MGKNLAGKEIGKGIVQRKNTKYYARTKLKSGKTIGKEFTNLKEAKQWLVDAKYEDTHSMYECNDTRVTLNEWFDFWMSTVKEPSIKKTSVAEYNRKYRLYLRDTLGSMKLCDIRVMHVQCCIASLYKSLSESTVIFVLNMLYGCMEYAKANKIITENPVNKSIIKTDNRKTKKSKKVKIRFLSSEEQADFVANYTRGFNGMVYEFILETGLRYGEVMGLQWDDIDFESKTLTVQHNAVSLDHRNYDISTPKSNAGYRVIPLTAKAISILKERKSTFDKIKYIEPKYRQCVFVNNKGKISDPTRFNNHLWRVARKMGRPEFTVHALRHTFATRCIEAGMRPKTLQYIMGHSNISVTMNLYVHTDSSANIEEMLKFEKYVTEKCE